ncbi:MAG: response regulator [Myxococcales bacterium]|nr:response regulator [Myxococcales bacterium]
MARFLLVDDDGFTLNLLADTLRALGHEPSTAPDARQGLQLLLAALPDFVITEVRLPGWDGIELTRRIALLPKPPPVILTSAVPDFELHEEALRRGVRPAAFLKKPFDRASVARTIRGLTGTTSLAPQTRMLSLPPHLPLAQDEHPDWLARARGSSTRLPPVGVWFVASRRQASGAIVLTGQTVTSIGIKRGQIVDVTGMAGLGRAGDLSGAIGAALAAGTPLERTLEDVATHIARWVMTPPVSDVAWSADWTPGANTIPLPGSVPRALGRAIAQVTDEALGREWASQSSLKVTRRTPTDAPADRWGLDPQALRAHRLASGQTVQALVYELSAGVEPQRTAALRALDLLRRLNLITLQV